MNTVDIVQLIEKIRIVERKMGLVYTLFKVQRDNVLWFWNITIPGQKEEKE
jgi:hypothetical protein